jgi:hypothetical protein
MQQGIQNLPSVQETITTGDKEEGNCVFQKVCFPSFTIYIPPLADTMAVEQFGKAKFWRGVLEDQLRMLPADVGADENQPYGIVFTYALPNGKGLRVELDNMGNVQLMDGRQQKCSTFYHRYISAEGRVEQSQTGFGVQFSLRGALASEHQKDKWSKSMAMGFHIGYHHVPEGEINANPDAYIL